MFQEHSIEEKQCFWETGCVFVEPKHTTHTSGGPTIDPQLEKCSILKHLANCARQHREYYYYPQKSCCPRITVLSPLATPPLHSSLLILA